MSPAAAREQVRVARRVAELPHLRAAFARGELCYSQVRAVTRVATPDTEADLLEIALHATASQLETIVRASSRASDDAGASAETTHIGDAAEGAEDEQEELDPETIEQFTPSNADALILMARTAIEHAPAEGAGGEHQVVVHVDAATLAQDEEGACELEHGPALAPDLSNLIQLCSHHHRLVHEAGYTVERRGGGRVRFRRPDGRAVPAAPGAPQGEAVAVPRLNGTAGVTVDDTTCVPRVHSERMQLHWILDGLAEADPRLRALDAGKAGAEFPICRSAGRNTGDAFFSVEGSVWREAPNALASGRMRQ